MICRMLIIGDYRSYKYRTIADAIDAYEDQARHMEYWEQCATAWITKGGFEHANGPDIVLRLTESGKVKRERG